MFFLRLLVFSNLFLIPIFLHPYIICRHFIHIGHEPFHPKPLQINSYELYFYNLFKHSNSFIHIYPLIENENIFQQLFNYFFGINQKTFYPNLIKYTNMYIYNYDSSPFFHSFLSMYMSYFFLIYCSSLVHVYRIQFDKKPKTLNSIRYHIKQLIESSYLRWIIDALLWKLIGIILSHIFYVLAIKISMQRLFLSYEHFHLNQNDIYSSWNLYRNIELIYKYEGWNGFFNGILSRIIYELGKSFHFLMKQLTSLNLFRYYINSSFNLVAITFSIYSINNKIIF